MKNIKFLIFAIITCCFFTTSANAWVPLAFIGTAAAEGSYKCFKSGKCRKVIGNGVKYSKQAGQYVGYEIVSMSIWIFGLGFLDNEDDKIIDEEKINPGQEDNS